MKHTALALNRFLRDLRDFCFLPWPLKATGKSNCRARAPAFRNICFGIQTGAKLELETVLLKLHIQRAQGRISEIFVVNT